MWNIIIASAIGGSAATVFGYVLGVARRTRISDNHAHATALLVKIGRIMRDAQTWIAYEANRGKPELCSVHRIAAFDAIRNVVSLDMQDGSDAFVEPPVNRNDYAPLTKEEFDGIKTEAFRVAEAVKLNPDVCPCSIDGEHMWVMRNGEAICANCGMERSS